MGLSAYLYLGLLAAVGVLRLIELRVSLRNKQRMLAGGAVPVPEPGASRERIVLKGDVPSPVNPPKGCRFHTRCPYVFARCRIEEPQLRLTGDGHFAACHLNDLPVEQNPLAA